MTEPLAGCPLCRADEKMLEHLSKGRIFCGCCGQVYQLDDAGHVIGRHVTNHARDRKTDVSGHPITDP